MSVKISAAFYKWREGFLETKRECRRGRGMCLPGYKDAECQSCHRTGLKPEHLEKMKEHR